MEGMAVKRRRIYSVEPNRRIGEEAAFARKYVSYLVPALKKIMKESMMMGSTGHGSHRKEDDNEESDRDSLKKFVKYEVDMALVLSANDQSTSWTNALKLSLHNELIPFSSSSSSLPTATTKTHQNPVAAEDDGDDEDDEEEEAMKKLRRLVPGGEDICSDQEMVQEFKSYVKCLQMQVNILQCLAQSHSF